MRRFTLSIVCCAIAFALTVAARRALALSRVEPTAELGTLAAQNEVLERKTSQPAAGALKETQVSTPYVPSPTPHPDSLTARARATARLRKNPVPKMLVGSTGKVTGEFGAVYGLSDPELRAIEQAVESGREQYAALVATSAATAKEPDRVTIEVRPFDGSAIYDKILGSVMATLGGERAQAFIELHARDLEASFSGFGAEKQNIQIGGKQGPDGGDWLTVRIERVGTSSQGRSTRTQFLNPDQFRNAYWPYIQFVPHSILK